jgi:hypothetical protein
MWRIPKVGGWLARQRWSTRLGWQANRLAPHYVFEHLAVAGVRLDDAAVWLKSPRRLRGLDGVPVRTFIGVDRSHWWLIARRAS